MCGITGIVGKNFDSNQIDRMWQMQCHRGPDDTGIWRSPSGKAVLAHNRLSILDLSEAGHQPMHDGSGRYTIIFNGEVYNYLEIRRELEPHFQFRTGTDTEVILNAYRHWGEACLDKFIGMFAFVVWDEQEQLFFAARDRFGVKPFYYAFDGGNNLLFASEIKSLHNAGIDAQPNEAVWAAYLTKGQYGSLTSTFWKDVFALPGGHSMRWRDGNITTKRWYALEEKSGIDYDPRSIEEVTEEYYALLQESIRLRFRSDVPVGINLSGGLDSSALLFLVDDYRKDKEQVKAFTFVTNDERYDELPWVNEMIARTRHELVPCLLTAQDIPRLTAEVTQIQDEPFGGIPTLAYAKVFEEARKRGVIVLLDGQGMDEQWAGYDYYRNAATTTATPTVQGSTDSPVRPQCLDPEFATMAEVVDMPSPYPDKLRNLQYRDTFYTKIPRALRFNDRVSMRSSTELREPFLDHRLFELAFRQRPEYKIQGDQGKYFMRRLLAEKLPGKVVEAPKRPLQTPQREWLRQDLREWVLSSIDEAVRSTSWLNKECVEQEYRNFAAGKSDNAFYIWQWISLALLSKAGTRLAVEENSSL